MQTLVHNIKQQHIFDNLEDKNTCKYIYSMDPRISKEQRRHCYQRQRQDLDWKLVAKRNMETAYKPAKRVCHAQYGIKKSSRQLDRYTRNAFQAIRDWDLKALKRSLHKIKDVNARWRTKISGRLGGKTLLHEAVMASNKAAVHILLAQPKIDANASFMDVNGDCWTPLSLAKLHRNNAILSILRANFGEDAPRTQDDYQTRQKSEAIGKASFKPDKENDWRNALQSNLPSHQPSDLISNACVCGKSNEDKAKDSLQSNETTNDKEETPFSLFSESASVNVILKEQTPVVKPFSIDSWLEEVSLSQKLLRPKDILNLDLAGKEENDEVAPKERSRRSRMLTKRSYTIPHENEMRSNQIMHQTEKTDQECVKNKAKEND